ncbi:MAG TPA: hypothetical protein VGN01_18555 [Acidobacteriaceae bacterium]
MLLLVAAGCVFPRLGVAQAAPAGSRTPSPSKVDIYAGYGYLHPVDSDLYGQEYTSLPAGSVVSLTGYLSHSFGLQGEYSKFFNDPDYCFSAIQGGPVYRHPMGRLVPFAHILGGAAQVGPSYVHNGSSHSCDWGWTATGGLGLDYILPASSLRNHLALRLAEADFEYSDVNYGARTGGPNSFTGGESKITALRLSAGFVFRFGEQTPPLPASFGCEAQPVSVYPGDPVTITGRVINLEPKKNVAPTYTWTTTGGRVTQSGESATIATNGLAAGDYTVSGEISEGSQPTQHADCTTSFRVTAYEPPTVACSANPTSIQPGGFATITASGRSPQNRTLNYSYGASAGQITGTGTTGTLSTADVGSGPITVTCNVVDDLGKSASATTTITVVAPPPPPVKPAPTAQTLCSISFERDRKRPARVDNEAKGCLDDIALEMNRESDSVLVVVGKHDPTEKPEAAAERTLNVKQYLTDEKGINANRIQVRTGEITSRTVDNVLVPPGATWDTGGTMSFDPTSVKRHGEPYSPAPR